MSKKKSDLHGNVDEKTDTVLLLIDVINDFDFPESDQLLKFALPAAKKIAALKKRCKNNKVACVYVNDNFGIWRSDFKSVLQHCLKKKCKGRQVAKLLEPDKTDYFVLKPKHSAFHSTTLNILLEYLQPKNLIISGFAGNICVLFSANDAYMADYKLYIPADCVASNTVSENNHALTQMEKILKADITESDKLWIEKGRVKAKKSA